MGSCEEYASEYISTKAFKLIGIGSITQPFGYHIIKDYHRPAVEKSRIKLNDVYLTDFFLCLTVLVNGQPLTTH